MEESETERLLQAEERADDCPMPRELATAIARWIEPHTMNVMAEHDDTMRAIEFAYPLIRDYLRAHPEA